MPLQIFVKRYAGDYFEMHATITKQQTAKKKTLSLSTILQYQQRSNVFKLYSNTTIIEERSINTYHSATPINGNLIISQRPALNRAQNRTNTNQQSFSQHPSVISYIKKLEHDEKSLPYHMGRHSRNEFRFRTANSSRQIPCRQFI